MKKTNSNRRTIQLSEKQLQQLRKDRELIAQELPVLTDKHERIREAADERTTSGSLRRAIHASKILLHDLAARAHISLDYLDAFLTGQLPLTSDVIDRLAEILHLKLETSKPKSRRAKAG